MVKSNPFEGGSDHTPFLNAKIPAVLLWHFTDQFYHTDRDRLEMVSATTLGNVGNCALNIGLLLTAGTPQITKAALSELAEVAVRELRTQGDLSARAIQGGSTTATERTIIQAWRDYYVTALTKIPEMAIKTAGFDANIAAAQARVRRSATAVLSKLGG